MRTTQTAAALVAEHGEQLVGKTVGTSPMGDYPGGDATVTAIKPDPRAPEIAFNVRHPTWRDPVSAAGGATDADVIGVFDYELVTFEEDAYAEKGR